MIKLDISPGVYRDLLKHLNPHKDNVEQAAFLFCEIASSDSALVFALKDMYLATNDDFEIQSAYHIELKDEIKSKVIRQAHNLGASIVEVHSHVDQRSAKFSYSDWSGFGEFVPHVMWRLKGRPYMALVFAPNSFDALVWVGDSKTPVPLNHINVNGRMHQPTSNSIQDFKYYKDESV